MKQFLLMFTSFVIISCSSNGNVTVEQEIKNYDVFKVRNKSIGEYHNYLMGLNIEEKENLLRKKIPEEQIISLLKENLKINLIKDFGISENEYENFINKINFQTLENQKGVENKELNLNTQLEEALEFVAKQNPSLSSDLRIISNVTSYDYTTYLTKVDEIKSKYKNSGNEVFVFMVIDVSKSSHNFWVNKSKGLYSKGGNYDSVWQADVSGAIIGGTWGGVAGSFGGGIGALPGALLGGGISSAYGSAAAGIWNYINNR
ncbi:MAG: hypothetical protein Q4G08_06265 [Capnocytophaga sp.]|nr:hypothetical protein [Capnocytophaga sp.]